MSQRTRILTLIAAILLFIVPTILMLQRHQEQLLWGNLPLFQFTGFWIGAILILQKKIILEPRGFRIYGLATLSAILLALGFPPSPLPFLLFVAFVPLLYALHLMDGMSLQKRTFLLLIFHTFLLWNIWSTYWVANSSAYAAGIFANVVNAFLMCLPVVVFRYVVKKLGPSVGMVTFAVSWLAFEFLHMHWDLYWPWLTLGNGLSGMHYGVQWYSYTGVLGGSLWILLVNYKGFQVLKSDKISWRHAMTPTAGFLIPLLISLGMYYSHQESGEEIEVVAIQPNLEPHYEKFSYPEEMILSRFFDLSREKLTDSTDYLLFPETSFSSVNLGQPWQNRSMQALRSFAEEYPGLKLITGLSAYRILSDPDEQQLPTSREIRRGDETLFVEFYNCAVELDAEGVLKEYYKSLYVPGAEFFPFRRILFFLQPIVNQLGGTLEGYRIREEYGLFGNQEKVAAAICYESIFGEYMGGFVRRGAEAIFILTNDGWWDNTAGHIQHAEYARLRSIETRRSVARAANMGTCCFINQRGDMSQATEYGEIGSIRGTMRLNRDITFYTQWGDVLGRISVFICVLLWLRSFIKRYVK